MLDPDELVVVAVGLAADVLARAEPHHRELRVLAGEQDGAKRVVVECPALDVVNPAQHGSTSCVICVAVGKASPR